MELLSGRLERYFCSFAHHRRMKVRVRQTIASFTNPSRCFNTRQTQVSQREAHEDPRTVAALPARDETPLVAPYAISDLASCVPDEFAVQRARRWPAVIERDAYHVVARQLGPLVLHGREHDHVERDTANTRRWFAALREPRARHEVRVIAAHNSVRS